MIGRQAAAAEGNVGELELQLADFFAEHYERLVRLAGIICHAPASVEDAVQVALEQAWRRRHSLRDVSLIRPWLDQIVVREAIRLNKRPWWSRLQRASDSELVQVPDRRTNVDASVVALTVAFRALPPVQRAAVALHLYAGYSVEETARLMSASIETTRSRLRLARQRLRRELAEDRT